MVVASIIFRTSARLEALRTSPMYETYDLPNCYLETDMSRINRFSDVHGPFEMTSKRHFKSFNSWSGMRWRRRIESSLLSVTDASLISANEMTSPVIDERVIRRDCYDSKKRGALFPFESHMSIIYPSWVDKSNLFSNYAKEYPTTLRLSSSSLRMTNVMRCDTAYRIDLFKRFKNFLSFYLKCSCVTSAKDYI